MEKRTNRILLVDDSGARVAAARAALESGPAPVEIVAVQSLAEARLCLNKFSIDLVISELLLPDGKSLALLSDGHGEAVYPVVIMTNRGDVQAAVEVMKAGALDYVVTSDASLIELPSIVDRAVEQWAKLSERKRAAENLRESEYRFRSFFESSSSGMVIMGPEGNGLKMNPTFCRLSGYSEDEALQMNVFDVTHPAERAETLRLYDEVRSGRRKVIDYEKRYRRKDGSFFWGRATVAGVFGADGALRCFAGNVQDITKRKKAEAALRISEEKFRTIFNSAGSGMITLSPAGKFLEVNGAICTFLGYSRDELFDRWVADITHPADLEQTAEKYRLLDSGQSQAIDYQKRFLCKDGKVVWGHVSMSAVLGEDCRPRYYIGLVQDINESKLIQDQIQQSKHMLQLVIDSIPQHVFWKDRNSVYLGCNRNFAQAAGVEKPQNLIGKTDYELPWRKEEADFYRECDRRVMEADMPELHIIETQLQASGKQVWVDTNKIPLHDGEGWVVGVLGTFEDISERKRAEDELIAANRELDAFVYTVSHDLRTPLTPIIGFAEELQVSCRDRLDEQSLDCLAKIENQGRRMMALMEDLLVLARVGHLPRPLDPVDLNEVLEDVLIEMWNQLAETGVVVERAVLPGLKIPRTLLQQIFDNLIGNAVRYAGRDGGPIEVAGERTGDFVRISVRDHGPGISLPERQQIFDLFYRGAAARQLAGTGIGLTTVQKISRLYCGRAWVEETPGGGSTFWVELKDA